MTALALQRTSLHRARRPAWPRALGRPRRQVGGPSGLDAAVMRAFSCVAMVLVVYLLPLFRAEATCGMDGSWAHVPAARHGIDLELGPIARLDAAGLTLDGRRLATLGELDASRGPVATLVADLETLHRNWFLLHPRDAFPGTLLVAADSDVPFAHVRRVAASGAEAGYGRLSFVVRQPAPLPIEQDGFARALAE